MVKIRSFQEPTVQLYYKEELIGEIKSALEFWDVMSQIKEENTYGYSIKYNGNMIKIDKYGTLEEYPDGLYDQLTNILLKLV